MLHFMILLATPLLAAAAAVPAKRADALTNFYLSVVPTQDATANSTGLGLADPYYDPQYFLHVQADAAGYPTFNLTTNGTMTTIANTPHGVRGQQMFEANYDLASSEFYFLEKQGTAGLFSFDGDWLAYNGSTTGFTVCEGALGLPVVFWNGTDSTCEPTFIRKDATSPPTALVR